MLFHVLSSQVKRTRTARKERWGATAKWGFVTAVTAAKSSSNDGTRGQRVIAPRPRVPGGRALLGGLLMALSAVGVFVAYQGSSDRPSHPVVVAAHDLRPGEQLGVDDLRVVAVELPSGTRAATFAAVDDVVGRIVLGPVSKGELLQEGALTADRAGAPNEIAISLPRAQVAVGRLKQGERVDVYVTYDDRTTSVVRGVEVVQIGAEADRSVTSDREVEIVVAVESTDAVAALVHALRTGEVTVVRSTFATERPDEPLVHESDGGSNQPDSGSGSERG